jgi:16S rRNA (cytidine1402-2'-O)-methyltransferase
MKTLYLLPNLLNELSTWHFEPPAIQALIAESEKGGRIYTKRYGLGLIPIYLLNEHSINLTELEKLPYDAIGLISDAGMPCLADPGAQLVSLVREQGVDVHTYPGPSSIFLSLILSGFPAQQFNFCGYLERDSSKLIQQIKAMPRKITHLFIETPYRNTRMLEHLLATLHPNDRLCVAQNLMAPDETVISQTIKVWKLKQMNRLEKKPAVFLIYKP